ncbi:ubiquitin recognition factor in ER-associated degradation protein 1-like isoform X2 [Tubulanus polymorphus]|uniref:ubiquitin recognition factor in ER-associated degradation protein 1-like isoform X2 n=1 Tax=Tubulanus polymorphus TaxID=672921 RepID=UPI003DA2843E
MFSYRGEGIFPFPGNFKVTYRCYSVSMLPGQERPFVERGGKIIMPPSALDQLTRLNIQYPMLFKLTNQRSHRDTHCGVLEFVADEGRIYLPYWMMRNLLLEEGGLVQLESVSLPIATFAKFQPQSTEFLDITNPKAVLENALRNFACLSKGDMVAIKYNERIYELCVLETKPGNAVSIIECDMNVEFAAPVGYQEPERVPRKHKQEEEMAVDIPEIPDDRFRAFSGSGNRLDGKRKGSESFSEDKSSNNPERRGIPNYNYKKGTLTFIRTSRPQQNGHGDEKIEDFAAFGGEGQTLRKKDSRK